MICSISQVYYDSNKYKRKYHIYKRKNYIYMKKLHIYTKKSPICTKIMYVYKKTYIYTKKSTTGSLKDRHILEEVQIEVLDFLLFY